MTFTFMIKPHSELAVMSIRASHAQRHRDSRDWRQHGVSFDPRDAKDSQRLIRDHSALVASCREAWSGLAPLNSYGHFEAKSSMTSRLYEPWEYMREAISIPQSPTHWAQARKVRAIGKANLVLVNCLRCRCSDRKLETLMHTDTGAHSAANTAR
jgi:hypothetical protein